MRRGDRLGSGPLEAPCYTRKMPSIRTLAATLLLLFCFAEVNCGPGMPTEAEARAAYTAQKSTFDAVDASLRKAIAEIPHFGVPADSLPCKPPPVQPTKIPGMEKLVEGIHCTSQQIKMLEARNAAIRAFESETLLALVKQYELIGMEASYTKTGDGSIYALGRAGSLAPGYKDGTVRAAKKGITIGDRRLGWGVYQDPAADHAYRRGLEVIWTFQQEQAKVRAQACAWVGGKEAGP